MYKNIPFQLSIVHKQVMWTYTKYTRHSDLEMITKRYRHSNTEDLKSY